ncbi:hypothetical protein BS50DRAFT_497126 [Corynespora cassiicola Philippines]|uniref:Uncharacterized protein n=1 Tax=Corynespora cassiicola Philippines TaxID=1448308 RepID=A0A2T2NHM5_CORCC|nr:hypothetical protein BS50DRAFT_497126 [Corynespora cassiicola Philippines]
MSLNIGLQEACLIRHFSEDLAHAFDTTDRDSHYTLTVPQRAMHSPVLLYAICTASARHLASIWRRRHPSPIIYFRGVCLPELNDETAIHYHNICLQQLMTFSDTPASEFNAIERADALAATTILRFYEQLDTSLTGLDSEAYQSVVHTVMCNHHIEALFSLESIDRAHRDENGFPNTAEGLRASACLIALRQEIWSVLLYRRPFRLPISSNLDYTQLGPADDYRWTNRIILWCADVLRYCFGPDTATTLATSSSNLAFERWDAMKAFEEIWTANQPSCFRPLHYAAPQPSRGAHFPVIWHMNDCQVQGAQHLELGRMLLAVYNPRRQRVGIGSSAMNHAIEEQLRSSILRLCGLAMSNKKFQAGMTTAAVGISIGGEYFRERDEQDAIIGFLDELEEEHAWPTRTVVRALQDAWSLQRGQAASSMPKGPASV